MLPRERATQIVLQMKDAVASITETYAKMPKLIEEEHDAISNSDIDKVEAIVAQKLELGAHLDRFFMILRERSRELSAMTPGDRVPNNDEQATLSTSFTQIESLIAKAAMRNEDVSLLARAFEQLKDVFESFHSIRNETVNLIEVNKMVLSKLLAHRQENYRFWQEITADTMAAYDRGGKQKANRSGSTLNIKA